MEAGQAKDATAAPQQAQKNDPKSLRCLDSIGDYTVYCTNMPTTATMEEFQNLFSKYGKVIAICPYKPHGTFQGVIFLKYENREQAEKAIAGLNGISFKNKAIVLRFVDQERAKRKMERRQREKSGSYYDRYDDYYYDRYDDRYQYDYPPYPRDDYPPPPPRYDRDPYGSRYPDYPPPRRYDDYPPPPTMYDDYGMSAHGYGGGAPPPSSMGAGRVPPPPPYDDRYSYPSRGY